MDDPERDMNREAVKRQSGQQENEGSAQNNSMDYAELMQLILKQSEKLEHVKNNVSESQDREKYMELIKQSSKQGSKFLTLEIGDKSREDVANAPQTSQNKKKQANAFHRFHKRRRSLMLGEDFFSAQSNNQEQYRTAVNARVGMRDEDREEELNASKQSAQDYDSYIFDANDPNLSQKQQRSVYRFEPSNLNQPFFNSENFKDYILVDIPENICVFEEDSEEEEHRCLSQMSQEVFRIVDEREKHIQNLYEAGDFIGDYVKHRNNNNVDVEISSAKSEVFGGSVHDQSQGQLNFSSDNFNSNGAFSKPSHKVERRSFTEEEMLEAARQFQEKYHFQTASQMAGRGDRSDGSAGTAYCLLSSYIFGEPEDRAQLMKQLKQKCEENGGKSSERKEEAAAQPEDIEASKIEEEVSSMRPASQMSKGNQVQNADDHDDDHVEMESQPQVNHESAHNYFDNSQNQSNYYQEDFQSTGCQQRTQKDDLLINDLIKIQLKLKLAYQVIQKEQKAKIALVVKLKAVNKELQQLKAKESASQRVDEMEGAKRETKNQYCQTMKASEFNEEYFHRWSGFSRRSSYRNANNVSGLSSQKHSFRTENPFEVFNNKASKSPTDSEIKEKRQSMKLKYQKIQNIKQNKRAIMHPRASVLSSQNSFRWKYGRGHGTPNGYYHRNYLYRNSERLQKFYEGQYLDSSRRHTQKDFSQITGKLYNSFQIQKDIDDHFNEFQKMKTQRFDHSAATMQNHSQSKQRHRNSFRHVGREIYNYNTMNLQKRIQSNESAARKHAKSTESLKIADQSNTDGKHIDEVSGFELAIPEENEEFFSQSPHASVKQQNAAYLASQQNQSAFLEEGRREDGSAKKVATYHHHAPSFGKKSQRMEQIEVQGDGVPKESELPKHYNILTNPSEKDFDERDEEFAQKYDLFDHKLSGPNTRRSQKNRSKAEDADAKEQLRKQEQDFHLQLKLQKEQLYYQFNQRYSNAKKFWKTRFDDLLREKKRQLEVMQQFNVQMQNLQSDHQKTKDALKSKESNIEMMTDKLCKQQAMIKSMFNDYKQFANGLGAPSSSSKNHPDSYDHSQADNSNQSSQAHQRTDKSRQQHRRPEEQRPSTQTKAAQKAPKVKSSRAAHTIKNSPYKHTIGKEKYNQSSLEKQSHTEFSYGKGDFSQAPGLEVQQSVPRKSGQYNRNGTAGSITDAPRKSTASVQKSKKKLQPKTQLSQERSPELRRERHVQKNQETSSNYPSNQPHKYNQFGETVIPRPSDKSRDAQAALKAQKSSFAHDNTHDNTIYVAPGSLAHSSQALSGNPHHGGQLLRRESHNSRNQISNTVDGVWNYEQQNRGARMLQEKNYQHQMAVSHADIRHNPNTIFSAGKQSSTISTKEYLRAYILSGDKKPIVSLSNDNSFSNTDPMLEQRQSKTEVKTRADLKLTFQPMSQESESYYQVITLPNDKSSLFDDRPPVSGPATNNGDSQQMLSVNNAVTPIGDEANYRGKELSQQKIPVKIQSAKIEKQAARESSRNNGRLKVKGNIKEFISKQHVSNTNIKPSKGNYKQSSSNVLYSETSNNISNLPYYPQKQKNQPQPYDLRMRDLSQDGLRLRNTSKSITRTYPHGNTKKDERVAGTKSPRWQKQSKETLKTQSPVLAQKQQRLQMTSSPYTLTAAVNKSDKKPTTSSQKVISTKAENALQKAASPLQPNFVKSKADYLYAGGGAYGKQGYQNYQQPSYYDMLYKKNGDRETHKSHLQSPIL